MPAPSIKLGVSALQIKLIPLRVAKIATLAITSALPLTLPREI